MGRIHLNLLSLVMDVVCQFVNLLRSLLQSLELLLCDSHLLCYALAGLSFLARSPLLFCASLF